MPFLYKLMFFISISLAVLAVVLTFLFGLNLSTDFKGGSILEIKFFASLPAVSDVKFFLDQETEFKGTAVTSTGNNSLILRLNEISEDAHQELLSKLKAGFGDFEEQRFSSIGAVVGKELQSKSITAIIVVLLLIIIYIAFVFRKLSKTLPPFAMGIAAIIALIHDVVIPAGVFAVLGYYYGVEITAVFVAAALTILGYSVSDTVVVFDRVRENILRLGAAEGFGQVVHKSVMQTLSRSLNTTLTTLLSLLAIYFWGGESVKYFSLATIIGIFLGAYSSIFVASPVLVWFSRSRKA